MLKIIFFSLCLISLNVIGEDHEHKDAHKDEHADDHRSEHNDGPHENGFTLNGAATKNFNLQFVDYVSPATVISSNAILKSLSEINVYRFREGFYKRIDFKTLEKNRETLKITSSELATGDKIVVSGVGFLRIAEIAASGGISDSHSH